jgi:branched-subunit amino acid aminotransferase/4-amino-4-deoxychorismate lyase
VTLLAVAVAGRGIVDPDEPVLNADDEALLRGRAAFETTRVYAGRPFKLDEHLARLAGSAARIGLPPVDVEECESLASSALEAAGEAEAVLRLYWTAGREGSGRPTALALVSSVPTQLEEMREHGIKLIALPLGLQADLRAFAPWLLGGVKSTSYAVNMAAEAEAKHRGADDAVFLASGDIVLEGPVTNVWWRPGSLHTGARARHPRGSDAGDVDRGGRRARLRGARGSIPARAHGLFGGGFHLVLGARGDARHRARRGARRRRKARPSGARAPD